MLIKFTSGNLSSLRSPIVRSTNISAILRYKEDIGRDAELDIVVKKKKEEGVEMKMLRSAKVSIINKALQ